MKGGPEGPPFINATSRQWSSLLICNIGRGNQFPHIEDIEDIEDIVDIVDIGYFHESHDYHNSNDFLNFHYFLAPSSDKTARAGLAAPSSDKTWKL